MGIFGIYHWYIPEVTMTHIAKLFKNGRSQAVRLPAEFRFEGNEVYIRRDEKTGDVILSNKKTSKKSWAEFFALRDKLIAEAPEEFEGFMEDREQRPPQERDLF
jgi:antitoxin VapB